MPRQTTNPHVIDVDACRAAVVTWRKAKFDSVRQAAIAGKANNETWGNFENGATKSVTPKIRRAMIAAFGWPEDWPTNPPPPPVTPSGTDVRGSAGPDPADNPDTVVEQLALLHRDLANLVTSVEKVGDLVQRQWDDLRDRLPQPNRRVGG